MLEENGLNLTSCLPFLCRFGYWEAKWKPFIVWYLSTGSRQARYSELRKRIPYDISHKMFSQHLSELEQVGIIERIVVEVKPLRVDYLLTAKGVSFANVLYFIRDWGRRDGDSPQRRCNARKARWVMAC